MTMSLKICLSELNNWWLCIMGKLEEIIANIFELDPSQIKKEMTPADIETWDSLSQLDLLSTIEKEFKIKLEFSEIFTVMKIDDIYKLLSKKGVL